METLFNADLLSVGVTTAATLMLGFLIYINDRSSITSRTFFAFAIVTSAWSFFNYISYKYPEPALILFFQRIVIFLGVWQAFTFFRFVYVFPRREVVLPFWLRRILTGVVIVVSLSTLTPFVFSGLFILGRDGAVSVPQPGPGLVVFLMLSFGLVLAGIFKLIRKVILANPTEKKQYTLMTVGALIMFVLIVVFNVIYPALFREVRFIPLGALFVFPFVALTWYATYRHHLFNVKVATTAFLGLMLTVFSFVNILYSQSAGAIMINVTAFIIILLGSITLVKNTLDLEEAKIELQKINIRQESLLHFVSHEVKTYLTKGMYAFTAITMGDFGRTSPELQRMASSALIEMKGGVATVLDILNAADLKKGIVSYSRHSFDVRAAIKKAIEQLRSSADEKHLTLDLMIGDGSFILTGDEEKITQHIIRNLIDNAIQYALSGTIHIDLVRKDHLIRFSVKDNGIGITPEDMPRLFTEGGKGRDSIKVNVHSTGYGLFIAKTVTEAHGGKIWAESKGAGQGARFVVEFPVA